MHMKKIKLEVIGQGWAKRISMVDVGDNYVLVNKKSLLSLLEFLGSDAAFGGGFYVKQKREHKKIRRRVSKHNPILPPLGIFP